MAGERATIGTLSFFPSKNLGAYGDGGMMLTQDEGLATRLKRLRVHGGAKTYFHDEVGYNSRLDALQAVVLSAKLPHLEAWSAKRRANAAYYDAAFADLADVQTPYVEPCNVSIFNQYTLRVARRDDLQSFLKERGIGNSIYYPLPLHLQPCFAYLGTRQGAVRRPSVRRERSYRCRSIRSSRKASSTKSLPRCARSTDADRRGNCDRSLIRRMR